MRRFLRRQQQAAEGILAGSIESRLQEYDSDSGDIAAGLRELIETEYCQVESTYFRTIFAASLAKMDFVSSFPGANYGSLVAALPPLRHVAPVRAVQAMGHRTPQQLSKVIDTYRHHYRLGLDLIHPRWDEDRVFVEQMLAQLPISGGKDPRPGFECARDAILQTLPRWKHKKFQRKLDRLRHLLWLREELRDISNRVYHLIRKYVLAIARHRGLDDSIFFQAFPEIFVDARSNIERNREIYQSYRNFKAPNEIGGSYQHGRGWQDAEMLGIAASPGILSATAFIANSVEEAVRMPSGQILVCPYTDPGWTPVLDRVGGVVTETGGLLSHAAIICREYGIPAVLGVENATNRIADGANLVIHGSEGRVCIRSFPDGD